MSPPLVVDLAFGNGNVTRYNCRTDTWVDFTAAARVRDQARWPTIGTSSFPNCTNQPRCEAEVIWLHDWIAAPREWLDAQAAAFPGSCP